MAWFDGTAATPGRLLNEVVRLVSTRLAGRRVELRVGDAPVHLTVDRIHVGEVPDGLESAADDLFDVVAHLGDSARRHPMDPVSFGLEAVEAVSGALDRAAATGPGRALRGEIDLAASVSARLLDVDADAPGTHTASVDIRSGPVTARVGDGFVVVADDISMTACVDAEAVAGWLRLLGVDLGPATDVEPGGDGRLRVALGRGRLAALRRLARLVVTPTVEDGRLALAVDAVELLGWRVPLPSALRRRVVVDLDGISADLELRRVDVTDSAVVAEGWLPRLVQPITLQQFDELRQRLTAPRAERLEVGLGRRPGAG